MQDILIRPYENEDWTAIENIHDSARKTELALAGLAAAFIPLKEAAIREGLLDYQLLVAELEGRIEGFAAYCETELAWLYVSPEKKRCGIGETLVRAVLARNSHRPISIEILVGNEPARRLYEKCGFRLTETVSGQMPGNERFAVSAWCMELS